MSDLLKSMIAGASEPAGTLEVVAPFDRSVIARIATSGADAVEQALDTADKLFQDRSKWLPAHVRITILKKTVTIMTERAEQLALEAAREGGKPLIDSRVEVARAIDSIRLCIDCLRTDTALPKLLKGGLYHAGQVCVSVQRIYAHESIARDLALKLSDGAAQQVIGDPTLEETEVGPLIRPAELERIDQWVKEAIEEGAELLAGGKAISETLYKCTVLYNPSDISKVSQLEIFGPVICVYPYTDINEAIEQANQLPYAFQAAVFSSNLDTALYAYKKLDASAVMVNEHTAFRVDWMPFAGLRESGLGIGGIPHTFRDMQIEKMIVIHSKSLN